MNSVTGAPKNRIGVEQRQPLDQGSETQAATENAQAAVAETAHPKGISAVDVDLPDLMQQQREARVQPGAQSIVDFGDTGGLDAAYQLRIAQGLAAGTVPTALIVGAGHLVSGDPSTANIVDFGDVDLGNKVGGGAGVDVGQQAKVELAASRFLDALEQRGVSLSSLVEAQGSLVAEFHSMADFDKARALLAATRQGTPTFEGVVVDWRIAGLPPGA